MLASVRAELNAVHGAAFVALWSDKSMTPQFDARSHVASLLPLVDALGSDFPPDFWRT